MKYDSKPEIRAALQQDTENGINKENNHRIEAQVISNHNIERARNSTFRNCIRIGMFRIRFLFPFD